MIENIIKDVSQIIRFDSSQAPAAAGAPFGQGARDALDYFLALAKSMGFATADYDGYAGEVIYGSGEEFAILAHLDVVPAGSGWVHDPFGGEIDRVNCRVWGRGAMDDKGPAVIALYALKALKDEGFKPNRKIKLIVGCNEESGWGCIEYYKAHAHMPDEGFSPDADFPVIYAEKGILHIKLNFPIDGRDFKGLSGGERVNMVCDRCEVAAPVDDSKLKQYALSIENGKIISRGKSAHGSTPDQGVNAISAILKYLGLDEIYDALFGKCFNLKQLHDETGYLTFSPNIIGQTENGVYAICDIRYPATLKMQDILGAIDIPYEIISEQAPLYNDKNCFLIKTLCRVYNEVTGKNVTPVAIGGGTYARALKCGAAFGPEEEGEENTIHQANEYITFEKIEKCFEIYKRAIKNLTE